MNGTARLLLGLWVLSLVATGLPRLAYAPPSFEIFFDLSIDPAPLPIDLTPFDREGDFDLVFKNTLGVTITDLHFVFVNFGADATADGDGIFKRVASERSGSSLQFQEVSLFRNGGTGVAPGEEFRISATGFDDIGPDGGPATLTVRASVPEPASVLLLTGGLIGFGALIWRHRQARRGQPLAPA